MCCARDGADFVALIYTSLATLAIPRVEGKTQDLAARAGRWSSQEEREVILLSRPAKRSSELMPSMHSSLLSSIKSQP